MRAGASCRRLVPGLHASAAAAEVLASGPVRAFFTGLLTRLAGESTGSATRVTRALLMVEPPSIDRGEVTDKGSINQRAVLEHRAVFVEALYDDSHPALLRPARAPSPRS